MRTGLIGLLLLGLTATAGAQSREGSDIPRPSIGLPLPHIGLPLPPIGLPLPPMGLPPQQMRPTIITSPGEGRPPRFRDRGNRRQGGAVILYVPAFDLSYLQGTPAPSLPSPPPEETRATGHLLIELPSGVDPQVFVDDYFVGTMSDLNGEFTVEIGRHTLELIEEGYETLRVDVEIRRDTVATWRGELKPIAAPFAAAAAAAEPPAAPPPPPTTIYVIPGCYVGNVSPSDATLPPGCDARDAIAFPSRP